MLGRIPRIRILPFFSLSPFIADSYAFSAKDIFVTEKNHSYRPKSCHDYILSVLA